MSATTPTKKGVNTIVFGTDEGLFTSGFITESEDIDVSDVDSKEFRDEQGNVIADYLYSPKGGATVTCLLNGGTLPAIGAAATVNGVTTYYVTKVGKAMKNDDGVRITVTMKRHAAITP